jgi:hypothetical protein
VIGKPLRIAIVLSAAVLYGCSSGPSVGGPIQVSATPQATLGTPLPTLTPKPTPTAATVAKAPKDVLLVLNDMPAGFRVQTDAETTIADLATSINVDPAVMQQRMTAMGWLGGWHRSFQKDGFGIQQIFDSSNAYESADGAKQALAENVRLITTAATPGIQISLGGAQLGDEALAYQVDSTSGSNQFTTLVIYFRFANLSNSLSVSGTRGLVELSQAITLAQKQLSNER